MGFRDREKERLFKLGESFFDDPLNGVYKNKNNYPFCLTNSTHNLFPQFRNDAITYFKDRGISWHDGVDLEGKKELPSTHLCCSQSACINFNYPFIHYPNGLEAFLGSIGYSIEEVLPITLDGNSKTIEGEYGYVAFEWIGKENYLHERMKGKTRTRGQNYTSADFIFRFRQHDDKIHIILGEWKYTENYTKNKDIRYSKNGTDRLHIYLQSLKSKESQITVPNNEFEFLFIDPFDQLMRLQLLASLMEKEKEMDADIVSVLHIVPGSNKEFCNRITSPSLHKYGDTVHEIWHSLTKTDRFKGLYLEDIIDNYCSSYNNHQLSNYIKKRYGGMI